MADDQFAKPPGSLSFLVFGNSDDPILRAVRNGDALLVKAIGLLPRDEQALALLKRIAYGQPLSGKLARMKAREFLSNIGDAADG